MGLADDIINGKYRASVTGKKKKKEEESLADQIIAGTYRATITTPSEAELDDIAPVKKQEEDDSFWGNLLTDVKVIGSNLLDSANAGILQLGKTIGMRNDEFKNATNDSFNDLNRIMIENQAKKGASEEEIKKLEEMYIREPVDSKPFFQEKIDKLNQRMAENTEKATNAVTKKGAELAQSIGNTLVGMGVSAVSPTTGLTYFVGSATGSYYDEGIQRGMSEEEAKTYGSIMGTLEGVTEKVLAGQNIKGFKAILEGQGFKNALKAFGLEIGENALQEAVMPALSELTAVTTAGTEHLNYDFTTAEGWKDLGKDSLRDGIDGALSAILINGATKGVASATRVVNKINDGQTVTQQEIATAVKDTQETGVDVEGILQEELTRAAEKGIAQNQAQIEGLQQEIVRETEELNKAQDAREKQIIQETINGLNEELNELTNAQQITDESELRKQNFTYEAQETDSDIRKAVYESASQVMNNTEKSHKFVDVVAKIAEERGTTYKFTNNEQLKQLGYAKENVTVNGLVNENGEVLINIDSAKMINTVVGHETTHLLEGTKEYEALKQVAIEYAKTKGDYDARIETLTKLYEGTNADIEAELTSDIVGEYLFTDENFVKELSIKQPTIFEKIKNFINDLVVKFKGTDQEKQLRQLQRTFEKAYKAQGTQTSTDTKYSTSEEQYRFLDDKLDKQQEGLLLDETSEAIDIGTIKTKTGEELSLQSQEINLSYPGKKKFVRKVTATDSNNNQSIISFWVDNETVGYDEDYESIKEPVLKILHLEGGEQGKGHGTALLKQIINEAKSKGIKKIIADDTTHWGAVTYWEKQGFTPDGKKNHVLDLSKQSTTDNQGRTLTKEQQEYFKDSKVRDENGNLVKVYHGTNKAGFTEFKRNVNYFTDNKAVAQTYTGNDGIYEGYVNITNPITVDAAGEIWSKIAVDNISIDGINNVREFLNTYGASTWQEDGKLRTSTADLVSAIEEAIDEGEIVSDGVIIKNIYDEGGYSDSVGGKLGTDYVTFNSNQFKNVDNTNPTTNPDIRYSLSEDGKMVDNKGNEVKLEAAEAGTHGTLMVIHNFDSSVTKGVLELGGFPAPSIAITNPRIVNHKQFGDVSVLFNKSTIDPANRKNEVYDRDVWSQDFPDVEYDINNADIKKYISKNLDYDYKDDIISRAVTSYMYDSNLSDKINSRGIEQTLKDIKDDNHMKYLYKTSVEKDSNYKPEMKEKKFSDYYENQTLKRFIDSFNKTHDMSLPDFFYHYINYRDMELSESEKTQLNNQIIDAIKPEIEEYWNKFKDRLTEEQYKKAVQEEIDGAIDSYGKWYDFLMNAQSYDKNGEYQVIDREATLENIDKHINKQAYEEWVDSTFGEMFKNTEKGIRNNKDPYTASGNRRSFKQLHDSYNLENIVKAMTAGETKGGEGGMFSGGFGTIQAKMARRFNSIEDIKAYEDRLTTDEQAKVAIEPLKESIRIDIEELSKYYNSKSSYFNNSFENASEAIAEFAGKSKKDIATFKKVLNGFYNFEVENIPDSLYKQIINDLNNLKDIPTDYFEAKPQRAIRLDEAEAFVVPNDMDADLKQQLRDRGINVIEYDPNIEGDRQAKISEFDDLKFSLSTQNEEIAPTGQWNVRGEDIKYQVEEAIAPLQETISNLTEQVKTMQESFAPTSQDIVEQQGQEAFNHITDKQAPKVDVNNMSWEDAIDSIMDSGDFEYSSTEHIPSPLDSRDIDEVGDRKVKAYQYENPEVKPFFQAEAENMLYDLANTIKGEKGAIRDELGNLEYYGITRQTTEAIAYLKDNYGYSYEQIRQGLNKIIEDDGKENNAVSKRIEFLLDERLREGYTTSDGYPIPPNEDYINFLNEKQVTEYNKEAFNALTDADVPQEQATMNAEPELKASEQVIPIAEKTAQKGNTSDAKAKERSWPKTSTESEVVNREILPDDLDYNAVYYQPITNKETLREANNMLGLKGYEKSVEYFNNQFLSKKITVEDIALGERLIQEAIKNKDTKTAGELIQNIAILGTELGQKVQALSIIQRMTPEGQLKMLEKTINRGKVKGDKAFTDIELTQKMKDKILKTYNEDGSYNQDKLNEVMDEVKQEIADQMQVTAMDKINAWRYLSMLGNPKTHIRNLVSNVAMQGTLKVKNAVARTIEDIAPIKNKTKTWKAASEEVTNFAKQTALEMKDVISGDSKYSESTDIKAKRQIFKNKVIEKLANLNSDMLEKEDWWFSKGAFESSFREFLTANGISTQADIQKNPELIEKGKNYAVEQAQIATFRQYSWLANKIRDIESKNAGTQIAVGAVLPFKKTPINIAKAGLNYSPLGFAKTLTYDISQVKKGNMEASTLIDHIAQNTTGTALTLVGYMLAQAGFLNGAGDDDKEGKYDYQLGKQAYSINIGGNTYSLSWLSPVAMPLFVGANAYEQLVEGEEWNTDVVLETLGQTLDPLSEMSFLSSLDSVLSSYDSGVQRFFGIGEAMAQNYVTQFVPTASSQLAATLDDTKRSTKVSGDSTMKVLEETYNKLIYKIPFLRETLEPTTDIWGNEVKQNENLFTRAFENFIAPYSRKESIATEIDNELKNLYSQTGDNGLLPSIPYNYVNYDGEKYNMSAKEYTDYKKTYGQTANDLLEDLFRTTTYQNATSEERADMVNDVYDYARDEAKLDYLGKEGVDYTNATKEGEEYYKVNDIKGAIDNDMTVDEYRLYSEKPEKYNFFKNNGITYSDYEGNKDLYNYAYEHQDKFVASKAITGDFETYYSHLETMGDFDAKDEYGNSVSGLKKSRVFNYINGLDLSRTQKMLMFKMQYPKDDDYISNSENVAIVQYVSNLDMDYADKVKIIESLGMTIKNGRVYWK